MGKKYVKINELLPDMLIEKGVYNHYGQALVKSNTYIRDYEISGLAQRGIKGLYIHTDGPDEDDFLSFHKSVKENPPVVVSELAKTNISLNTTEDPSKVNFSNEIRDRISVGIEYLYNNVESLEMDRMAKTITNEIMDVIHKNNAVALDLNVLKASDEYTFRHSVDVATISMVVGGHLGYSEAQIYDIGVAALLHDIGKFRIPLNILNKAGKLTDAEFEIMKQHPVFGYEILKERDCYSDVIKLSVLQHHEKINGTGYPYGLKGDKIQPYAKLISVADIYDALVTDRPYKDAYPQGDAVEMIMSLTDDIDNNIMGAFLSSIILYPVGSRVRLSNGEIAQVVRNYGNTPLRPNVIGLETGTVYNLHEDMNFANVVIVSLLDNINSYERNK